MPAQMTDLVIEQGTTFAHSWAVSFNGQPIDETWTARAQARSAVDAPSVLHQFATDVTESGVVSIRVPADDSSEWPWRQAVYDLEVVNADETIVLRVARGTIEIDPEITR